MIHLCDDLVLVISEGRSKYYAVNSVKNVDDG